MGVVNVSRSGRGGVHGAFAFSRSHVKPALNGSRTLKSKRFSTSFGMPLGPVTPSPKTSCIFVADGSAC